MDAGSTRKKKPLKLPKDSVVLRTFFTGTRYKLWLDGDSLAYVQVERYSERLKRFALADIQAISMAPTRTRGIISIVLLVLACLFAGMMSMAFLGEFQIAAIALSIPAALLLLLAIINYALGPMCAVSLHTAVQSERLHSCQRMSTARKLLARITPEIQARQIHLLPASAKAPEITSAET